MRCINLFYKLYCFEILTDTTITFMTIHSKWIERCLNMSSHQKLTFLSECKVSVLSKWTRKAFKLVDNNLGATLLLFYFLWLDSAITPATVLTLHCVVLFYLMCGTAQYGDSGLLSYQVPYILVTKYRTNLIIGYLSFLIFLNNVVA